MLSPPLRRFSQGIPKLYIRTHASHTPTASKFFMSSISPRHLLSIADLSPSELTTIIRNAYHVKQRLRFNYTLPLLQDALKSKTIAMMFNKRSTRTRVSTESAAATLGGHAMFLGKDDIQLGVNESVRDTSTVISSMVAAIVARVAAHEDVAGMAKHSTAPVINALSDDFHPLQAITDCLTLYETFKSRSSKGELRLQGLNIAWVGDANNVLFDLAIAAGNLGINLHVATPPNYGIPHSMLERIKSASQMAGRLLQTNVPEEAVKEADVIFTDTWISMGQEAEKVERLRAFEGFQVTNELAERGGARNDWKFMHCLPRHQEEVSDEVFYHPQRSLVFSEAENRLYGMIAVLEAFVVSKGSITSLSSVKNEEGD